MKMKATEIYEGVHKPLISPCKSLVNDNPQQNPASAIRSAVGDQNMINDINLCLSRADDRKGFFVGERPARNLWLHMAEVLSNNFTYFGRALLSDPPNLNAIPVRADTLAQTVWHENVGIEIKSGFSHSKKFNDMVIAPLVRTFQYLNQAVLMVSKVERSSCEVKFSRSKVSRQELSSVAEEVGFAKYKIACWLANWAAMVEFEESVKTEINKILLTVQDSVSEMAGSRDNDIQGALDQYYRGVEIASSTADMRSIFDDVEDDGSAEEKRGESCLLEGSSSPFSETGSQTSEAGSEASGSNFSSDDSPETTDAGRRLAVARYSMRFGSLGAGDREGEEDRPSKFRKVDWKFVGPSDIDKDIINSSMTSNDMSTVDFGQFALGRGIESQKQQGAILENCRQVVDRINFMKQSRIEPQFQLVAAYAKSSKKKGKSAPAPISAKVIGQWPKVKGGAGVLVSQKEVDNNHFPQRVMADRDFLEKGLCLS